jgi:DNA-binding transcriptional LysR family regulator
MRGDVLNPRQLDAFRRVMETGSVSRACAALNLTQPAVSRLIAALEDQLGFVLFRRERQRLVPTAEAEILYRETRTLFGQFTQLDRLAGELKRGSRGHLVVAGAPAAGVGLLPAITHAFQRERPEVSITLLIQSSPRLVELARSQQIDVAISLLPTDDPAVSCETLYRSRWTCVLPPGHRLAGRASISPRDLEGEPFISLGEEDRTRGLIDRAFEETGVERVLRTSTQLGMAACEFVRLGAGVTLVDPVTAYASVNADLAKAPFDHPSAFELHLLAPAGRTPGAVRDGFTRHLKRSFAEWAARAAPAETIAGPH